MVNNNMKNLISFLAEKEIDIHMTTKETRQINLNGEVLAKGLEVEIQLVSERTAEPIVIKSQSKMSKIEQTTKAVWAEQYSGDLGNDEIFDDIIRKVCRDLNARKNCVLTTNTITMIGEKIPEEGLDVPVRPDALSW